MDVAEYFPMWDKLSQQHQEQIRTSLQRRCVQKGTVVHNGSLDCSGLMLVRSGQLRAYMLSDEGREITLYRLFERDTCLFSASCVIPSIQFELFIAAEKDSEIWFIPPWTYRELMNESAAMANYSSELMASRFSEVMWLIEQIMWKSQDKRLAAFLLEECALEGTNTLTLTHEKIANHLGTAREVVTRMLRYFQSEGLVKLTRGTVEVIDEEGLEALQDD